MSEMNAPVPRRVREAAAAWAVRLGEGELDAGSARRLARWLARDPRHGQALADAEMTWALAGDLRGSGLFAAPVPRAPRNPLLSLLRALAAPRRMAAGAGLALAGWLGVASMGGWAVLTADHRTRPGEMRTLHLSDGSEVLLGSDSALDVSYDGKQRRTTLLRGEAVFSPAPRSADEPRAFVVVAGPGASTALGTRYLVRREDATHTWVGVLAHSVEVGLAQPPRAGRAQARVEQGQSVRYSADEGVVSTPMSPDSQADWTQGLLRFEAQPLGQALARIDGFLPGRLVMLNREAARTPVTALVHLDSLDDAIDRLCAQVGLKAVRLPGLTMVY